MNNKWYLPSLGHALHFANRIMLQLGQGSANMHVPNNLGIDHVRHFIKAWQSKQIANVPWKTRRWESCQSLNNLQVMSLWTRVRSCSHGEEFTIGILR